jgi:short chain dehydrogenase
MIFRVIDLTDGMFLRRDGGSAVLEELFRLAIYRTHEGRTVMGKLEGKVAVITAATSGMALATAKLFVKEGAYVFITGRRKDKLGEAVKLIGKNVTGVQGDASNLEMNLAISAWHGRHHVAHITSLRERNGW